MHNLRGNLAQIGVLAPVEYYKGTRDGLYSAWGIFPVSNVVLIKC
jgi:hypothetical protein